MFPRYKMYVTTLVVLGVCTTSCLFNSRLKFYLLQVPYLFSEDSSNLADGLKEALDGLESIDVSDRGLISSEIYFSYF